MEVVAHTACTNLVFKSYHCFVLYYDGEFFHVLTSGRCTCNIRFRPCQSDAGDPSRNSCPCQTNFKSKFIPQKQSDLWSLIAQGSLRSKVFNFDQLAPLSDTLMLFVSEQSEKDGWCFAISELNRSIFAVPFLWTVYRHILLLGTPWVGWSSYLEQGVPWITTISPDKFCYKHTFVYV
jgi:hypothetical protein